MTLVAVSVDTRQDSFELAEELGIGYPLLQDASLSVARAYGVAMEGGEIAVPASFVVRSDGRITYRYIGETQGDRPELARLIEAGLQAKTATGDAGP